ncbi:MAG: hypothetical protein ABJH06_17275, partial [Paraglaciecola sp.]|uniref:hypothetical protein n=1 Tax=Paraglaciecola sp. TaxID=1920173 RepID=UPI00329737B1
DDNQADDAIEDDNQADDAIEDDNQADDAIEDTTLESNELLISLSSSDVSLSESNMVALNYYVTSEQPNYNVTVTSSNETNLIADISGEQLIIQAGPVDADTTETIEVTVTYESQLAKVSLPVTILQNPNLDILVSNTTPLIESLDILTLPFNVEYDGQAEFFVSIEDIEGDEYASVALSSNFSSSNSVVITGLGNEDAGTLTFNLIAKSERKETIVPVEVAVNAKANINLSLSNYTPSFDESQSSFTIVRICTDVSNNYLLELEQVSGDTRITASIEGAVISINSNEITTDTSATFVVKASILGVTEEVYFDVFVSNEA